MLTKKILLLFLCISITCVGTLAQSNSSKSRKERPKVGLVMSGGGAKGFAYVGLLKVLEEVNMPIDYIGGASMGAITASLYSVGYSPETITEIIRGQDWNSFISDVQHRKYLSYEEKLYNGKYFFSLPLQGEGISFSKALNSSVNIDLMLNKLFAPVAHITDFNDLAIPFLCIGTDLLSGEAVVLNKGNLARAVRASMAIPGYFSPTEIDGRFLIDGGVVNNYPAEQVKAMGADYVIGADVQTGLKSSMDEINSVTGILDQVISFNRVDANVKGVELTDYYVKIEMDYGMMDFAQYDSIIAIGERVARQHYDKLKALADSLNSFSNEPIKRIRVNPVDSVKINEVSWTGEDFKSKEKYKAFFEDMDNSTTAISDIEEKMLLLNGTGVFDDLHYEFLPAKNNAVDVKIEAENVNIGNIAAGIYYDDTYGGNVLLNLSLRNINGGNAKLFTDLVLGANPRLNSLFIINNGFKPGFGLEADLYSLDFSEYEKGDKVNKWNFANMSLAAFMPMSIRNNYLFKAGFQYELFRFKQDVVVDPELDAYNTFADYGNFFVSFEHDSRDRVNFTRRGQFAKFEAKHVFPFSDDWNDFVSNATIVSARFNWYVPLGQKLMYKPGLFAGYTFTDVLTPTNYPEQSGVNRRVPAVQHLFGFGGNSSKNYVPGHVSFTGLHYLEQLGSYAAKFATHFEYNFYPKLYCSVLCDLGVIDYEMDTLKQMKLMVGYGAKVSYDSFVGPVEFTLSSSNIDTSLNAFVNIGFWF